MLSSYYSRIMKWLRFMSLSACPSLLTLCCRHWLTCSDLQKEVVFADSLWSICSVLHTSLLCLHPLNTCVFPFSPLTLSAVVLQNRSVQALLVGDSCRLNCRIKTMIRLLFSLILSLCSFYMSYCGWWLWVSVCVAIMKIKVMQWLNRKKCP